MNNDENQTADSPSTIKRVGRPPSPNSMSAADRKRKQRERLLAEGKAPVSVYVPAELVARLDKYLADKCGDVTKDQVLENALRAFFRKR